MLEQRLPQLKKNLNLLYEQIGALEEEALMVSGLARVQLKQQMRDRLWPDVRKCEAELTALMSQELDEAIVTPELVEQAAAEILQVTTVLSQDDRRSTQALVKLEEILVILKDPKLPVAGKLKAALPIVPGIVTYEVEGDVESVVRRLFPTFMKLGDAIVARKRIKAADDTIPKDSKK